MGASPDGGFYIFPQIDDDTLNGIEFSENLLSTKGVAVVPGEAYGSEFSQFFRISVCLPEEELIAAARLMEGVL